MEFHRDYLFGGVHHGATARIAGDEKSRGEHEKDHVPHDKDKMDFDLDHAAKTGEVLVGSPETVVAQLERQYEESGGFGRLTGTFHHGDALQKKRCGA